MKERMPAAQQATDPESIARHCIALVAAAKKLPADHITRDSSLEHLQVDSLDKVGLSFDVEEAYGISIPDSALSSIRTVGDMADGVHTALQRQNPAPAAPETTKECA